MTSSTLISRRARGPRLRLAGLLATAVVLLVAPSVSAANATGINVQLPSGYSIGGTIRDSASAVLPYAYVTGISTTDVGFAQADATGKYLMQGLSAGSYQIYVNAPSGKNLVDGYYTTANASHFTASAASATKVAVGPNKTGIDVKLPTGFTLSGTITTTGGTPLANAFVIASGPSSDSISTDATGKYTLRGLAAGSYKLIVNG
ncbi:MAG: carboxypeptidase-like regulatory domain-containing protein, partial [Chloroflexota bacterium]